MISCTEFIPTYNELFKFLHSHGSKKEVVKFWENLADNFLYNMYEMAAEKGVVGCFEYWQKTLTEEAAEFKMTCDETKGTLQLEMIYCPSMGRLLKEKHIEPYPFYCEHCDALYRRILESLGFEYEIDLSECASARCKLFIRR